MNKIKKMTAFMLLVAIFALAAFTSCGKDEGGQSGQAKAMSNNPLVVFLADENGFSDSGFNDSGLAGCEKAAEEYKMEVASFEALEGNYEKAVSDAVAMEPALVICFGSKYSEAVSSAAVQYPEQKFAVIGAKGLGDNVVGVTFNEEQCGYLAGVVSGLSTKENIVGLLTGDLSVGLEKFRYGYTAGLIYSNPMAYLAWNSVESFTDEKKVKDLAVAQNKLGADIIYCVAGNAGQGALEAAAERGFWAIGTDQDKSEQSPDSILCSVVKRVDNVAYNLIERFVEGTLTGGDIVGTVADGSIMVSDKAGNLDDKVKKQLSRYEAAIAAGTIAVPYDEASLGAYRNNMASGAIEEALSKAEPAKSDEEKEEK